jgi:DnaJ-class molecular chaperone
MKADIWDIDVAESKFMARSSLMSNSAELNITRRERPVGICPRCHTIVRSFDQIGKKCTRPLASGAKCPGVIRSALAADEWTECADCHATGRQDGGVCSRCNGEGWLYDKRRLAV